MSLDLQLLRHEMQKQVYAHWAKVNQARWRLHDDQVKSAEAVLKSHDNRDISIIPVHAEKGVTVIAFAVSAKSPPEENYTQPWAKQTAELCRWPSSLRHPPERPTRERRSE